MRGVGPLGRKLLRDLWGLRGQLFAIALVLASGVAAYAGLITTHDALLRTQTSFYRDYAFADVFVALKRAPERLAARIRAIPGVAVAETRVTAQANLEVPGFPDPATALLVSIPDGRQPRLNRLFIAQGRLPRPHADDEVVVGEAFAEAHGLRPGASVIALINGRRKVLRIVGVGLSPEFIYPIKPGDILPDFSHYAVMWMNRRPLATAYDMDGAFNNVVLRVQPGVARAGVVDRLDDLVDPYGGLGAHTRRYQISNRYLTNEMHELGTLTRIVPLVFLGVAAFLLNVVVHRLIRNQREQIGVLKAFGYANRSVALHYVLMVLVVAVCGAMLGIGMGVWIGKALSATYRDIFRFPFLLYRLDPGTVAVGLLATTGAALLGTLGAVRAAARLPPAAAMRPESPPVYRQTLLERTGLRRLLDQPSRMIARHLERQPFRSLLSVTGIAAAIGIMMLGRFGGDAIRYMTDIQFNLAQREDMVVSFTDPTDGEALYSLEHTRGIRYAEPFRAVPVELIHGRRSYRTVVLGLPPGSRLHRVLGASLRPVRIPPAGILLTDYLGTLLDLHAGDHVTLRVLEGARPRLRVTVAGFANEYLGSQGYMRLDALNRLLQEGRAVSGAYLAVYGPEQTAVSRRLQTMPRVAAVSLHRSAVKSFYDTIGQTMNAFALISSILAGTIAFGVVYNSARIALSERSRELASLRVLGYSRSEVAYILVGELAVLTLLAIGPGFLIGRGLCWVLAEGFKSDLYRIPLVLASDTYGFAAAGVFLAAAVSALLIVRRLDRVRLVEALTTRE